MGSRSQAAFNKSRIGEPPPAPAASSRRRAPASTTTTPCGACKFLRRKCTAGCVFAAHFASDQGAARFAAVHKVFGASNVSKLLSHLPPARRRDAVATICYEAQARLSDPVYGCVATVLTLQQQVAALQAELSLVQAHLVHTRRTAAATVVQGPQDPHTVAAMLSFTQSSNSADDNPAAGPHRRHDLASFPAGTVQEDEGESGRNPMVFVEEIFQHK